MAKNNSAAFAWREALIRHFLNVDLPALGINVEPQLMRRYWRMLAHLQGQLFNASTLAGSLGISASSKRLVKSPKVYVRDSGLLHSLLSIREVNDLLGHPCTGASWEGLVVEQIANHLPSNANLSFYRTAAGTEMDAVVEMGQRKIGFETKFSSAVKVTKGFWQACEDLQLDAAYVVAPVQEGWPMKAPAKAIPMMDIDRILNKTSL